MSSASNPMTTSAEKVQKATRRHAEEAELALNRRLERFSAIRMLREDGTLGRETLQVAQALILCGLPYRRTGNREYTKTCRLSNGEIKVTFTAGRPEVDMPFGADRTLLHFLLDQAIKRHSRVVRWANVGEVLRAMGRSTGGRNYADLWKRFERLSGLIITVERSTINGTAELAPIFRRPCLHQSTGEQGFWAHSQSQRATWLTLELEESFYNDLLSHSVPVPAEIIRCTQRKPRLQDTILFLYWRCFAAKRVSVIRWDLIRDQIYDIDRNPNRLKSLFTEAIQHLRVIHPQMQAAALKEGLRVGPPDGNRQLLLEGTLSKRIKGERTA